MRELLQQASIHIRAWHKKYDEFQPQWLPPAKDVELLEAIDEALSRSKWLKVADGLPVVLEGRKGVHVWVWNEKDMVVPVEAFMTQRIIDMVGGYTHWMYRQDDTPAPPRSGS